MKFFRNFQIFFNKCINVWKRDAHLSLLFSQKLADLKEVLKMLQNEQPIPADYLPHPLSGKYKGCLECHINGDFLLIWFDKNTNVIELVRLGSHSELFK